MNQKLGENQAFPFYKQDRECFLCGSKENIEEHHVDWQHRNNRSGNQIPLCKRCHVELHTVGFLSREELEALRLVVMDRRKSIGQVKISPLGEKEGQNRKVLLGT